MERHILLRPAVLIALGLTMSVILGCDTPRMCSLGVYRQFVLLHEPGYEPELDTATIWMAARASEGDWCLPRDLTVRNLSAPQEVEVDFQPPGWIKGQPLMAVYIYGVSRVAQDQLIKFEVWQGEKKQQTIQIGFTKAPDVHVIINGQPVVPTIK